MLEIKNLTVSYGAISALHGISLSVQSGSIVTLIGSNGAGKTTTLKTISGLLKPKSGEIFYNGKNIAGLPPHEIVARGLSHVPEGRMIFSNLTVLENLQMGAYLVRDKKVVRRELEFVFAMFPRLKEREQQTRKTTYRLSRKRWRLRPASLSRGGRITCRIGEIASLTAWSIRTRHQMASRSPSACRLATTASSRSCAPSNRTTSSKFG